MNLSRSDLKPTLLPGAPLAAEAGIPQPGREGDQHLGFKLAHEEFLLAMEPVREIIMLPTITFVPRSNAAIEGIFSLRGEILPVLNLRRMLGLSRGQATDTTRVVILACDEGSFGIVVDNITEFAWLAPNQIEALDLNLFGTQYNFLSGVSKVGDKMRGILDVPKLIAMFRTGTPDEDNGL
jgi:purine-binding chemotaxis protein CheW